MPQQASASEAGRRSPFPARTTLLGLFGCSLVSLGAVGAGSIPVHDPLLSGTALTWVRFGHGKDLATAVLYCGLALVVWAWVRLGRMVHARQVHARGVLAAVAAWTAPLLLAPPLFSRDVYSYLGQGNLALHGLDPYEVGPSALPGPLADNVGWLWQNTPAPYGPLFVLLAKGVVAVTGQGLVSGVILMRLVMVTGLVLLCWSLPGLVRHLGGRTSVALWLTAANPLLLVHLVGGPHNDLLMVGLLGTGVLLVLDRRPVAGIAVVTLATAVKATAAVALPFLVWIWAKRVTGTPVNRFVKTTAAGLGVFTVTFAACTVAAGVGLGWIGALSGSSAIVNWLSLPTAAGLLVHSAVDLFVTVDSAPFLAVGRTLGSLLLVVIAVRQWWAAREGGPDALRRCALVLLAVAALSPATLPWYFSWALVLAAALAWNLPALVTAALASVWLLLVTFPNGDTALYSWGYLVGALLASVLAAVSLVRPDPLGLSRSGTPADTGPAHH